MSISGLENTFKKNDASDIIAPTFTWDDIQEKPIDLNELVRKMAELVAYANQIDCLAKSDTLKTVKNVLNSLISILNSHTSTPSLSQSDNADIRYLEVDWNEILNKPHGIDANSLLMSVVKEKAQSARLLDRSSTLGNTKEVINEVLLESLKTDLV